MNRYVILEDDIATAKVVANYVLCLDGNKAVYHYSVAKELIADLNGGEFTHDTRFILDVILVGSEKTGLEVAEKILCWNQDAKILIHTGSVRDLDKWSGHKLLKPTNKETLLEELERL